MLKNAKEKKLKIAKPWDSQKKDRALSDSEIKRRSNKRKTKNKMAKASKRRNR
jgi:hypothetical protein